MSSKIYWPPKDLDLNLVYGLQDPEARAGNRRVLKLCDNGKYYALQLVSYSENKLQNLQKVMEYLNTTGFNNYPKVYFSVDGMLYTPGDEGCYILSEWIEGKKANLRDYDDLISIAKTLGQLHQKTRGKLPSVNDLEERWKSTLALYKRLDLSSTPEEIRQLVRRVTEAGQKALVLLKNREVYESLGQPAVLCLRTLSRKNFLINEQNESYLLGLEQAMADIPLRDLTLLVSRILKMNNGDTDLVLKVIAAYCHENLLTTGDFGAMLAFLYFPHSLWEQGCRLDTKSPLLLKTAIKVSGEGLAIQAAADKLAKSLGF